MTRVLLEAGARVAQSTTLGVQPLHMAAQEGHVEVASLLLRHGAPCAATDRAGWSALHYAANHRWATWRGPIDGQLAVIELLARAGADVDAGDGEGYTCAHSAAQSGKTEIVRLLRALGARPDATTVRGVMPIHVAAEGGRAEVVDELLDWCPDLLEAEDLRGHRPLHHASYHGRADVVEVLLRRGAEVSPRRRRGGSGRGEESGERRTTPLHLAARSASLAAVTALLAGGADPAARDADGWTPRALAAECARRAQRRDVASGGADGEQRAPSDRERFAAVDAALELAERGAPLVWRRESHAKLARASPRFAAETRLLLDALWKHSPVCTRLRGLPATIIADEVVGAMARTAWPREMDRACWGRVERVRKAAEARHAKANREKGRDFFGDAKTTLGWYGAAGETPRGSEQRHLEGRRRSLDEAREGLGSERRAAVAKAAEEMEEEEVQSPAPAAVAADVLANAQYQMEIAAMVQQQFQFVQSMAA